MKKFLKLIPIFLVLGFPSVSHAKKTGYIVELIIFEDTNGRYIRSEDWTFNDKLLHAKNIAITKGKPAGKDPQYAELSWKKAKLKKSMERIKKSKNYNVLIHRRWKQTGLDRESTINIQIGTKTQNNAANNVQNNPESAPAPIKATTLSVADSNYNTTDSEPSLLQPLITTPYVSGQVTLIMSRYLHFNVNLHYYRPQINESGETEFVSYPVVSERRMRSREIHYIDHPLVGVIVLATPYNIKSKDSDTDPSKYKTL